MGEEDYREVASFVQGFVRRAKWVKGAEGLCLFGAAVLRHRIIPNFKAQAEGFSSANIVTHLLDEIKPPTDGSELG
jgi:hypothetical protein